MHQNELRKYIFVNTIFSVLSFFFVFTIGNYDLNLFFWQLVVTTILVIGANIFVIFYANRGNDKNKYSLTFFKDRVLVQAATRSLWYICAITLLAYIYFTFIK